MRLGIEKTLLVNQNLISIRMVTNEMCGCSVTVARRLPTPLVRVRILASSPLFCFGTFAMMFFLIVIKIYARVAQRQSARLIIVRSEFQNLPCAPRWGCYLISTREVTVSLSTMEACQSGLMIRSWKPSYVMSVPWVRIPPLLPVSRTGGWVVEITSLLTRRT